MVALLLEQQLGSKVSEDAARKFYKSNQLLFSTEQVRAQHILVQTDAEAREMLKKASAPGADFQKLAEQFSRDLSAKNNRGELGYFSRDQLSEEFTKAAFGASTGDIVGPVKTLYGYHIIRVMDKKPGRVQNFAEVEMKARALLRQQLLGQYVAKLRGAAEIKVDEKALEKL
jgi:parvulin-like peptidyl-prolyl isomerase